MMVIRPHHWLVATTIALCGHAMLAVAFPASPMTSGALDHGEGGLEIGLAAPAAQDTGPTGAAAPSATDAPSSEEPQNDTQELDVSSVDAKTVPADMKDAAPAELEPIEAAEVLPEIAPAADPVVEAKPAEKAEDQAKRSPEPQPELADLRTVPKPQPPVTPAAAPPEPIDRAPVPAQPADAQPTQKVPSTSDQPAQNTQVAANELAALSGTNDTGTNAGDSATGGGSIGTLQDYYAILKAMLERHKQYPARAQRRGQQGTVAIALAINQDGQLADVSLRQSSGFHDLDRAAIEAVERAQPFPPIPDAMKRTDLKVVVPIRFEVR